MKITKHFENCAAPICIENIDNDAVWYAGEKVCTCTPITKIQKKQININNLLKIGKYRFKEKAWNYKMLSK